MEACEPSSFLHFIRGTGLRESKPGEAQPWGLVQQAARAVQRAVTPAPVSQLPAQLGLGQQDSLVSPLHPSCYSPSWPTSLREGL